VPLPALRGSGSSILATIHPRLLLYARCASSCAPSTLPPPGFSRSGVIWVNRGYRCACTLLRYARWIRRRRLKSSKSGVRAGRPIAMISRSCARLRHRSRSANVVSSWRDDRFESGNTEIHNFMDFGIPGSLAASVPIIVSSFPGTLSRAGQGGMPYTVSAEELAGTREDGHFRVRAFSKIASTSGRCGCASGVCVTKQPALNRAPRYRTKIADRPVRWSFSIPRRVVSGSVKGAPCADDGSQSRWFLPAIRAVVARLSRS